MISVTAFLRDHPDPTDEEIREALSGNLCRCTGYQGILRAVRQAAGVARRMVAGVDPAMVDFPGGGAARYAGARVHRVEDARLLTGRGVFVDDISLPGMLHACFRPQPLRRGPPSPGIDVSGGTGAARRSACLHSADLNCDVKEQWHTSFGPAEPRDSPASAGRGEVRFAGDPVALVVADSRYVAEDAADLVDVEYEPLPAVVDYSHGRRTRLLSFTEPWLEPDRRDGGGAGVHARRDVCPRRPRGRARRSTSRPTPPCPWRPGARRRLFSNDGQLTIYSSTQSPHEVRLFCSRLLGMPEHRIRVVDARYRRWRLVRRSWCSATRCA